jgi:hypothetical protein
MTSEHPSMVLDALLLLFLLFGSLLCSGPE